MRYLIFILFLALNTPVLSQSNHYWTQQYGARSSLMGGAVVGGVRDNSAIYYNPGALAFIPHSSVSVNANAYKWDNIYLKNGAGEGSDLDLESNRISIYPQLISGVYAFHKEKWRFGYGLLTRFQSNIKMSKWVDTDYNLADQLYDGTTPPSLIGLEDYVGFFEFNNTLSEQWGMLSIGYHPHPKIAVGLTQIIAYRGQSFTQNIMSRAIIDNGYTTYNQLQDVVYWNLKLAWKIGIALDLNQFKIGATFTTASVNLTGGGTVFREISYQNFDKVMGPSQWARNTIGIGREDNFETTHKTPYSVSLGIEYDFKKTKIAIAAEYFSGILPYNVIELKSRDFIRPATNEIKVNEDDFLSVHTAQNPVVNIAVGLEQHIGKKFTLYLGFRTDNDAFRSLDRDSLQKFHRMELDPSKWNLYHFSLGTSFKTKRGSRVNVGLNYGFGYTKQVQQMVNFHDPQWNNYLTNEIDKQGATATFNSVQLIIGYTHILKPREKSKPKTAE